MSTMSRIASCTPTQSRNIINVLVKCQDAINPKNTVPYEDKLWLSDATGLSLPMVNRTLTQIRKWL